LEQVPTIALRPEGYSRDGEMQEKGKNDNNKKQVQRKQRSRREETYDYDILYKHPHGSSLERQTKPKYLCIKKASIRIRD
jgi:hypothetical protein